MGFSIYYRSSKSVDEAVADAIRQAAADLIEGRTWLSCEPVNFFADQADGHLMGASKPNFLPDPEDAAAAEREHRPDGGVRDLLDILCELSRDFEVDWEFSHDYSDGPIGSIRRGVCDARLLEQIEPLGDLGDILSDMTDEEGDDDNPPILPFRRK
jgi:hypothetical protein